MHASQLIGTRLSALRKKHKISQDDLAYELGFKDRQTISAIENGLRRVTAEELLLMVEQLNVPMDYFTDPFRLVGEGRFCWRHEPGLAAPQLQKYEDHAGCWIAAYRTLSARIGNEPLLTHGQLNLTRRSSYEDAQGAGDRLVYEFELGKKPAPRLIDIMERELGILVLMVDMPDGISGAACRLPSLSTVLINRKEVVGRRHFDLAHELFHLLTWDEMPPEHGEEFMETGGNRVEQLANNFAGAVLMPAAALGQPKGWQGLSERALITRLNTVANRLQVTAPALKWRLVSLGILEKSVAGALSDEALRNNGENKSDTLQPPMFSKRFMDVIALAMEAGYVSVRRAASLLDTDLDGLKAIFTSHGIDCPVDL